MNYSELKDIVEDLTNRRFGYKKSTLTNLLTKKDDLSGDKYDQASFMGTIDNYSHKGKLDIDNDIFAGAVESCVKGYSSNKDSAIAIFKKLCESIDAKTGINYHIDFPPIAISNTFERLMYISKYIQDSNNKISDLEDILWVSSRTIEADLCKLRGEDDDPIQICGKKYIVNEMDRGRDCIKEMASTPHPFFLTCNLTEVILTLKGLKELSNNRDFQGYTMKTASEIWIQLSDYAKDRIMYVTEKMMPDEFEWFKGLNEKAEKYLDRRDDPENGYSFWTERACSSSGDSALMECMKNGLPCYVEYKSGKTSKFYKGVYPVRYTDFVVTIKDGDDVINLRRERILRSSTNIENMF